MSTSELVTAQHLQRKAIIYMLSRDFGGHMLALHALLVRLRVVQRNRPWTLHLPLKKWQMELCLSERFSGPCLQNHEIIHSTVDAAPGALQAREPALAVRPAPARPGAGLAGSGH